MISINIFALGTDLKLQAFAYCLVLKLDPLRKNVINSTFWTKFWDVEIVKLLVVWGTNIYCLSLIRINFYFLFEFDKIGRTIILSHFSDWYIKWNVIVVHWFLDCCIYGNVSIDEYCKSCTSKVTSLGIYFNHLLILIKHDIFGVWHVSYQFMTKLSFFLWSKIFAYQCYSVVYIEVTVWCLRIILEPVWNSFIQI